MEERGQPARKVAADHVAVLAVGGPAGDELGEDRRAAGEAALKRVLQIEQAEIILAALAHDDLRLALGGVGEEAGALAVELALERLGEGRDPHRAVGLLGPERGGGEIAQCLADPGAGFGEEDVGPVLLRPGGEDGGGGGGVIALALTRLGALADQLFEPVRGFGEVDSNRSRLRAAAAFLPFGQFREEPWLVPLRSLEPRGDGGGPRPAQAMEGLRRGPGAGALRPVRLQRGEKGRSGPAQEVSRLVVALRLGEAEGVGDAPGRRNREARRVDEGVELEQVEARQIGIAEPAADERRVEHDHRRFRRAGDRLAAADRFRAPVAPGDPDAAMGRVKRGIRERGHALA